MHVFDLPWLRPSFCRPSCSTYCTWPQFPPARRADVMGAPLECPTVRQVGFPSTLARRLSNGSSAHETLNAVSLRIQGGFEWTN